MFSNNKMYWLYLLIFIVAVMTPDIFQEDSFGLTHERIQELSIFLLGSFGFMFFLLKEHQLDVQIKEKEKEQRRLQQTAKDLVESYTYIGEINRKMDLLMQVGIGLSERTNLTEKRVKEIFQSISDSATFLLKGECSALIFFNVKTNSIEKEFCKNEKCDKSYKGDDLLRMDENVFIKNAGDFVVCCSHKTMNDIKAYLLIRDFDEFQSHDNNNQEILKYLSSQALVLYTYFTKNQECQR